MLDIRSGFMDALGKDVGNHQSIRDLEVSCCIPQRSAGVLHGHGELRFGQILGTK